MANSKSAGKRIEINNRNRSQNRFYKSSVKTFIKIFLNDLEIYKVSKRLEDKKQSEKSLRLVYSLIDKGTKKKIFHKNAAARKKSRLALFSKTANSLE